MGERAKFVAGACRFAGLSALVVLGACTAISGASSLRVLGDEPADGGAPPEQDGSSDGGGVLGDVASSDADADIPDTSNVIYRTGFDGQGDCDRWQTTGTVVHDSAGHAAPGSCRLCAPAGGNVDLVSELTAPRRGWVTIEGWVREGDSDDSALGMMAIKYEGSNSESGFGLGDSWDSHVNYRLPIDTGVKMMLVFGLREAGAGDCMLVDDVVVRLE